MAEKFLSVGKQRYLDTKLRFWFSRGAITNTIALKNLTEQYIVTHDNNEQVIIVHREGEVLPKMEFLIHGSGLH